MNNDQSVYFAAAFVLETGTRLKAMESQVAALQAENAQLKAALEEATKKNALPDANPNPA